MSWAIASALMASALRASSALTSARSSRSGTATSVRLTLMRMQRTLWMCAKVVAMFRRFDDGGKARQMWGAMSESNSWFIRSLTRHALTRAFARSTGARELRAPGASAIAGVDFGVGDREVRVTGAGAITGDDLGVGGLGGTATVAFGVA